MIEVYWLICGFIVAYIILQIIEKPITELYAFGIVLGFGYSYKYWLSPFLGFPQLPDALYKLVASIGLAWLCARFIWVLAETTKNKTLIKIKKFVFR